MITYNFYFIIIIMVAQRYGSLYLELNFANATKYSKLSNVLQKLRQNYVRRAVLNHLIKFDVGRLDEKHVPYLNT